MTHSITWIKREEKISKRTQKPYTSLSLKLSSYGDRYLNGFADQRNAHWQTGMDLTEEDILIEETEPNDKGVRYLNFKTPKKEDLLEKRVEELESWKAKVLEAFPKMDV